MTDYLDVGVAVPFTRVDLEANIRAHILRLSTVDSSRVHTFVEGQDVSEHTFTGGGSATGIGDIVFRTKYNFLRSSTAGVAAALDLRLPTGDENELLGIGTTQAKFFGILSSTHGRLSPHVNIGFTISGEGSRPETLVYEPLGVSDEFDFAGGMEWVAHPKLTVLGDILGRTLFDGGKIELKSRTFPVRVVVRRRCHRPPADEHDQSDQRRALSSAGVEDGQPVAECSGRSGSSTTPAPTCCSWQTCSSRSTAQG